MSTKAKNEGTYKKGDKVQARWSGSNAYYDAKILEVTPKNCKVQFNDGTVFTVKSSDIKKKQKAEESKSSSPSRTKSRSRSRSGGRITRSRSRSPARKEKKTPAPKSEKKTPSKLVESKKESSNANSVKKDETDSVVKSVLGRDKLRSQKDESSSSSSSTTVTSVTTSNSFLSKEFQMSVKRDDDIPARLRGSSRLAALQSSQPARPVSDTKSESNAAPKGDAKYSDDEEEEEEEEEMKTPIKTVQRSVQIFYFLATLFQIILIPTALLFLIFACTRKHCTVLEIPQFYAKWSDFFSSIRFPFISVVAFHAVVCILSLIPLGRKVNGFPFGPNKVTHEYRLNGLVSLVLILSVFGACSYFGLNMNWGFEKFKSISVSCLIYSILCSLVLHIISLVKGSGTEQSKVPLLGNFYHGTYINPRLFERVDIKTTLIRAGLIGSILMNLSILLKFFLMKGHVAVPLALTSGMQIFFACDAFIREEKMLSTATYTSDTIGYAFILTNSFLIPMGLALQNVYIFIYESKAHSIPHWCSAAIVALFVCGYYIYMASSNVKHNFRRNPFAAAMKDLVSIPTKEKKRLIASRLWGIVRHPNYLGVLIMSIAWTLPCGFSHFVPFGPLIMLMIALVVRCFRVEADCKEKYQPAWNNYTEKVRSRLLPYIF